MHIEFTPPGNSVQTFNFMSHNGWVTPAIPSGLREIAAKRDIL